MKVTRKGADRIASGHPWVFSSDIADRGNAAAGDAVTVHDQRGRALGVAHYSSTSQITLRMLAASAVTVDAAFYRARIEAAEAHRRRVVRDSEAYRLVHAEGDLLPGLIVDRYGDCFVIQTLDQGMDRASGWIVEALESLFSPRAIVARNDAAVRKLESLPLEKSVLRGELPAPLEVSMNGLRWRADLLEGQKTGVFLDQRENYLAAAGWARGQALDCFTCSGGFALHMAPRCENVLAVDSSAHSLELAAANRDANGIANVEFRESDVFDLLTSFAHARRRFDTIVLDPPAFAKSRQTVEPALRGYREINQRALRLLDRGGVLVTCSCSHHVSEAAFLEMLAQSALDAGRTLRVLERRIQAQDHPVLLTVPETLYLKCAIVEVL
ncbi:MAG: class I SAM-dependent rRNA methyltransferase [Bryobacteraceae bacterium]